MLLTSSTLEPEVIKLDIKPIGCCLCMNIFGDYNSIDFQKLIYLNSNLLMYFSKHFQISCDLVKILNMIYNFGNGSGYPWDMSLKSICACKSSALKTNDKEFLKTFCTKKKLVKLQQYT